MKSETLGYIPVDLRLKTMFDDFIIAYISGSSTDGQDIDLNYIDLDDKALLLAITAALAYDRGYFEKKEKKNEA